jgi:glutaredoxin 3
MPKVEMYVKTTCGYCFRARRLLDAKGVKAVEHIVDSGEKRDEMVERAGGSMTVPQIFIDGRHIGGCDDLFRLERMGKLDELLAA